MNPLPLGEKIKQLRLEQGISLRSFATRIKKSAAFMSDIELGRRFPSPEVLVEIARELKVEASDLGKLDMRGSIDDLKKLMQRDPSWGLAFRTVAEVAEGVSPEEMIRRITETRRGDAK